MNRGFADLPLNHLGTSPLVPVRLAAPRGFEPRFTDPKSAVLPLDEGAAISGPVGLGCRPMPRWAKKWSGRRDSNPRPSPWQGDALPTEPLPLDDATTNWWCREPDSNWRHRDFQSRALPTELSRPDGQPGFGRPSAGPRIPRGQNRLQGNGPPLKRSVVEILARESPCPAVDVFTHSGTTAGSAAGPPWDVAVSEQLCVQARACPVERAVWASFLPEVFTDSDEPVGWRLQRRCDGQKCSPTANGARGGRLTAAPRGRRRRHGPAAAPRGRRRGPGSPTPARRVPRRRSEPAAARR